MLSKRIDQVITDFITIRASLLVKQVNLTFRLCHDHELYPYDEHSNMVEKLKEILKEKTRRKEQANGQSVVDGRGDVDENGNEINEQEKFPNV